MTTDLLKLHLPAGPRRFRVGQECGCVFDENDDFDGWTLTLELDHEAQADAVARALRILFQHWQASDDTGGYDA